MKSWIYLSCLLAGWLILLVPSEGMENRPLPVGEENPVYALAWKASQQAVEKLGRGKEGNLLVLTNAGYAKVNGWESSVALDGISEVTGCSPGKENLLSIHSAFDHPLYFFFFNRRTGGSFYAEAEARGLSAEGKFAFQETVSKDMDRLFKHSLFQNISLDKILARPEEIDQQTKTHASGKNWASLVALAQAWSLNPPMELLRTVQFHDHICPGVMSGYYIARFLSSRFPIQGEQRYFFIASPSYCKDDALQVIFNQTVGKRGMAALFLSAEDQARLVPEAREAAGIFFRFDPKAQKGDGAVIGFAFDLLRQDVGLEKDKRSPFLDSLKQILWMVEQRDRFDQYVYFIKSFELPPGDTPQNFTRAGINPWEKLDLWNKKGKAKRP